MKIQNNIQPIYVNNNKQNIQHKNISTTPQFTGAVGTALNFLDTNQAWGAVAVDLMCMVLPRTFTDWFKRGAEAGTETARREGLGTFNHSMIGVYAVAAGLALASGINKAFGLKAKEISRMFVDSETMDLHGQIWDSKLRAANNNPSANPLREYLTDVFKNYEALSPTEDGKWVKFKDKDITKAVDILEQEIMAKGKNISKENKATLRNTLISSLGVENNLRIIAPQGTKPHTSRYTIESLVENTYKLGKAFNENKVKDAFRSVMNVAENSFLKSMKSLNAKRSIIGLAVATAVGLSAQPLNMYLTKKKTGTTGFVGGGEEDKSTKFKAKKTLASLLFGTFALSTIANPIKLLTQPKELLRHLQFKGFTPTINQFKFVYGLTIMSRLLSSRNDNELKESSIKDTLGFASWLILGNFVQKLVAQAADPTLLKRDGKGAMNWIKNSVLKTREEVLHAGLGDKVFKDGKALSLSEMMKEAANNKAVKKQLKILTLAQFAGYAYSALALGIGIPRLNIYLTKKRMAKQEAEKQAHVQTAQNNDNMYKPENIKFLSQFGGNSLIKQ